MIQVNRIAVSRPPEASPHQAIRAFSHWLAAQPLGRWLVRRLKRLVSMPALSSGYSRVLGAFSAPDHLWFSARPSPSAVADKDTLTVISANLWHDWPRHRELLSRLEAFAGLVEKEDADVLLLQEVAHVGDFRADGWLANRLGMAFTYGQANGEHQANSFEEGVAVLSRYPLAAPSLCYLAPRPLSLVRRLAIGATVRAPGGDFFAVSAHLGHGRKLNTRQLNRLQEWVEIEAKGRPAIIGGDFNTGERSPQMRHVRRHWLDVFRQVNPDDKGVTYHLRWPWGNSLLRQRLDYIFLQQGKSPWQVIESWVTQSPGLAHSDHLAVVARLAPSSGNDVMPRLSRSERAVVPVA